METALKSYFNKCKAILNRHHSKLSNIIYLPGTPDLTKENKHLFEKAIEEAENTIEFEDFLRTLAGGPLAADVERLVKKEEKLYEKKQGKLPDFVKRRNSIARLAGEAFFRNTGTYVNLWQGVDANINNLFKILNDYPKKNDSELIRLLVFDGFVLYNGKKRLDKISLPVGEIRKYEESELEDLMRIPQGSIHGIVNPEIVKKAAIWHILTVKEKAEYGGASGIWANNVLWPIDWETEETKGRESDVELIGPIFLCIGEDANLAIEIGVRTNIFEYFPIYQKPRNGYLPWDSYDDDGNPGPRRYVEYIGEDGKQLIKVFEVWQKINDLSSEGFLRYPTEAYVRAVMNLHISWESPMETFVGFVTVIESLLTPGTRQELTYKTALRGAALLASNSEQRSILFEILEEFYKMRSQIVHEGHTGKDDPLELSNFISPNLTEITRQIFLRYICLLYLGFEGELPSWVLPDMTKLSSRTNRPQVIAHILDGVILDANLTEVVEEKMKEWGIYEDWIRRTGLGLSASFQQPTR